MTEWCLRDFQAQKTRYFAILEIERKQIWLQESRSTQRLRDVPESSEEGGVDGVAVVHVKVVPAAFGGKVVEP